MRRANAGPAQRTARNLRSGESGPESAGRDRCGNALQHEADTYHSISISFLEYGVGIGQQSGQDQDGDNPAPLRFDGTQANDTQSKE